MLNIERKILIIEIVIIILEILIVVNQNKKVDTGLHKESECIILNDEIYCRIAKEFNEE